MNAAVTLLRLTLFLLLCAGTLAAQEKKEPPPSAPGAVPAQAPKSDAPLPKIDLPEFVITGSERIDLDVATKPADDEERLFTPERPTPGLRSFETEGAAARKQTKSFPAVPSPMNGKVFGGFGFYLTPQLDGWLTGSDERSSYLLNGHYSASEGHVRNGGWWRGGFGVKGRTVLPESSRVLPYAQLSGELRYGRESYRPYASAESTQVRDLSSYEVSVGAGSRYALPYRSLSGFDYSGRIGIAGFSASDSSTNSETDLFLTGTATTRFMAAAFRAQTEYRFTTYDMALPNMKSGQWFVLKGDGQTLLLPSLQLTFALQQFLYRGNTGAASGRLYPQAELRYFLTESATMSVGFVPAVERTTLSSLIRTNRYMRFAAPLLPSDVPVHVTAGLEFSPMPELTASAKFSYRHIDNEPTFLDTGGAKVWEVRYLSGVRSSRVDLSVSYRFDERQNVTAYLWTSSARQKDSSLVLPYRSAFTAGSVFHRTFDIGVNLEAAAEYVAARPSDFSGVNENAGYLFASVKGDVALADRFRAYAELHNLLDQHYYIWNGYRERGIYLLAGVSYSW
ncbi:MAG: hypothetical protein F9K22_10665 [Bacteroidetes bacterium]|nr:MAG: hypothetical protein F9K22_10665 [Bacteroidota bacterium]